MIFRLLPCHELQEPHGQVTVVCETTDIDIAVRGPAPKEIVVVENICITWKKVMIKQLLSHLRCRLLAISTRMCIYSHSLEANSHQKAQWLIVWPVCQSLETCFLISGRQFGTNGKLNSRQFYVQDLSSGVPANVHQCYGEFWYKLRRARRSIEGAGPVRMSDAILVSLLWVLAMANNKLSIEGILTLEQPFVRVRLFFVH